MRHTEFLTLNFELKGLFGLTLVSNKETKLEATLVNAQQSSQTRDYQR